MKIPPWLWLEAAIHLILATPGAVAAAASSSAMTTDGPPSPRWRPLNRQRDALRAVVARQAASAPYDLRSAAGYNDMRVCAQQCVFDVEDGSVLLDCDNYACRCKNYGVALSKMAACISNSCPGDASDQATASSILSVWCTPGAGGQITDAAVLTAPYQLNDAAGFSDMQTCAQYCVHVVDHETFADCDSYVCLCRNYGAVFNKMDACVTNSCRGDASDRQTASSILSVWCSPFLAANVAAATTTAPRDPASSKAGEFRFLFTSAVVSSSITKARIGAPTPGTGVSVSGPPASTDAAGAPTSKPPAPSSTATSGHGAGASQVSDTSRGGPSTTSASSSPSGGEAHDNGLNTAAIIGIVIGLVTALIALIGLVDTLRTNGRRLPAWLLCGRQKRGAAGSPHDSPGGLPTSQRPGTLGHAWSGS